MIEIDDFNYYDAPAQIPVLGSRVFTLSSDPSLFMYNLMLRSKSLVVIR